MGTEVGSLQASLSLDISNFAQGMQQAVQLVQQFGQQLKTALGNTQSFSALQRQASELKAEIEAVTSAIKSLQATMNNTQNSTQIFSSIRQHTAGLSGEFDKIHNSLQQVIDILQQLNTTASTTAGSTSQMATNMQAFTSAAQNASRNTRQTTSNTRQASNAIRQANSQANKLSSSLKQGAGFAANLKHIMEGIIISQSFYRLLNIMNELVAGSAQFMNNMAQTEIAFKYLLGSEEKASTMLESLQDLSISAPISTSDATEMSRKLMAMGFSAKSVIPTLKILTDTAAVFTNEAGQMNDMMQHVVIALGQMKSAGTVSMQELRQLYNAGIPIFQILQDGLGLTAKEVRNIGELGIDSGTAILAILTELQKKYSGAAEEMTRTIPGALEVIKDSLFVINNILWASPFVWVTKQLNVVADWLGAIVKIARVYGAGGIFQAMFPREWHMQLRNIIGTFQELGKALTYIGKAVGVVFKEAAGIIINIASLVGPPISILIHALSQMVYWIMVNIPIVRYLFAALLAYTALTVVAKVLLMIAKATKLLAIAQVAAQCVLNLIGALKNLWAFSKVGFILMMIAGAFLAVALASEKAKAAIASFFGKIQGAAKNFSDKLDIGFDPNKIAQPKFEAPPKNDWGDMADGLEDVADGYDDVADKADKATKAQKKNQSFLQSFDEVYQIKPKEDDGSSGDDDPAGNMSDSIKDLLSSLGDLDDAMNGMDWTGDFWADWGNLSAGLDDFESTVLDVAALGEEFWKALMEAFSAPEWAGAGLGAIIGALLGSLVGHPLIGAAIGALVGWVAGLFWEDLKNAFNLSDYAPVVATIAAAIGFVLGKLLGWGALKTSIATVGLALGSMVISMLLSKIAEACGLGEYTADSIAIGQGIGTLIGAAIGLALGHPILGAAIGNLAGGVVGLIWGALKEKLGVTNWQGIADIIGADLSAAFTGLAASFWSVTIEPLTSSLTTAVSQGLTFSLKNGIKGGILGAIAGLAGGLLTNALTGWIAKELDMGEDDLNNSAIGQSIGGLIGSIVGLIVGRGNPIATALGNMIGQALGGVLGLFFNDIAKWCNDVWNTISEWCSNATQKFSNFITNLGPNLANWFKQLSYDIGYALGAATGHIARFVVDGAIAIGNFFTVTLPNAWESFKGAWTTFWEVTFPSVMTSIGNFFSNLGPMFITFFTETLPNAWESFKIGWTTFWTETLPSVFGTIGEFFTNLWQTFWDWGVNVVQGFIDGFLNSIVLIWEAIQSFFQGFIDGFCEAFGIHSPAESMMPMGQYIIEGLIVGMTSALSLVWEFLTNLANTIINVLGGAFISLGSTIAGWASSSAANIINWVVNTGAQIAGWITRTTASIVAWATNTANSIINWANKTSNRISTWESNVIAKITNWYNTTSNKITTWVNTTKARISAWYSETINKISSWASTAISKITSATSSISNMVSAKFSSMSSAISSWATSAIASVSNFCSNLVSKISSAVQSAINWLNQLASAKSGAGISIGNFGVRSSSSKSGGTVNSATVSAPKAASFITDIPTTYALSRSTPMSGIQGAKVAGDGGVSGLTGNSSTTGTQDPFNNMNKADATNFASQVGKEVASGLAPLLATNNTSEEKAPVYVGTLIADDRGLKELERKLKVIRVKEDKSGR